MTGPPPRGEALQPAGPEREDLDGLVRRVDPDRWLSSRFIADAEARADIVALYAYDHELARAPRVASSPLLAEIRLAWWREALDEIYAARPVRRHPAAQALARAVRRRGIPRPALEAAIDARLVTLEGDRAAAEAEAAAAIAEAAALALDPMVDRDSARRIGRAWALGRLDPAARTAARGLSPAAFPAVAHAALAGRSGSELARRLRLSWAVARGRV